MMEGRKGSPAPTKWSLNTSMALPQLSNSEMWLQDSDHGGQDLHTESWCQLLLGGFVEEELDQKKYGLIMKRMESNNCGADQLSVAQEAAAAGFHHHHQVQGHGSSSWTQNNVLQASSPRSCVTTSLGSNSMLDFSSEGNSTETDPALKRTRVQASSSSPKFSTLKVRKEKLGDRITALHQLVSPFGKTDTASVLQEAIGYIRFLQSQIEALSLPYLQQQQQKKKKQAVRQQQRRSGKDEEEDEINKDLRSRGLCLVPASFTMHVGGDNGADFWAPALGGGL